MTYKNTRIYRRSLELVRLTQRAIESLPRGSGFLADQLRRASASIVLNFDEGCGKRSSAEQRRYFAIARASAYEVAAAAEVGSALGAIAPEPSREIAERCDHVAAMLTRFARKR